MRKWEDLTRKEQLANEQIEALERKIEELTKNGRYTEEEAVDEIIKSKKFEYVDIQHLCYVKGLPYDYFDN